MARMRSKRWCFGLFSKKQTHCFEIFLTSIGFFVPTFSDKSKTFEKKEKKDVFIFRMEI